MNILWIAVGTIGEIHCDHTGYPQCCAQLDVEKSRPAWGLGMKALLGVESL